MACTGAVFEVEVVQLIVGVSCVLCLLQTLKLIDRRKPGRGYTRLYTHTDPS
eukprot:m.458922 g.458922  ORF g.458922 m.458922 type:complete len:52 (+) comp21616_c0_seq1:1715-1870(+)